MANESIAKNMINLTNVPDTLQDIAYNIVQDKLNSTHSNSAGVSKERTIFVLGSKGVVFNFDIFFFHNKFTCLIAHNFLLFFVCAFYLTKISRAKQRL